MPVIDQSVVIARPVSHVFDYVVDGANLPHWDSSVIECVPTGSGPVATGTRYRGTTLLLGRRIEWTTEIVECVPGIRAESRSIEGPLNFTLSYDLSDLPAGCCLRYRLNADSGLDGAFGRAMEPLLEKAHTKIVKVNLTRLARLLGQQAA